MTETETQTLGTVRVYHALEASRILFEATPATIARIEGDTAAAEVVWSWALAVRRAPGSWKARGVARSRNMLDWRIEGALAGCEDCWTSMRSPCDRCWADDTGRPDYDSPLARAVRTATAVLAAEDPDVYEYHVVHHLLFGTEEGRDVVRRCVGSRRVP